MRDKINLKKLLAIIFILVIIVLVVLKILNKDQKTNSGGNTEKRSLSIPVNVLIVKPKVFENKLIATGSIISNEEIELKSEISGKIIKIGFKEGSPVKKGTLLIKINDADLQATLAKTVIKKNFTQEKEFRQKKLLEKNLISQEEYESTLSDLNSLKSDLEYLKAQIDKTEIIAPFDGTIGLRYVSEGSYITPSSKIATFTNTNPVKIDFAIPQKYSELIKIGKQINFRITATGKYFNGKIYAIEPKIDPTSRTLQVRAVCQNERRALLPGAYVEVELDLGTENNSLGVPTESVVPDITGEKIYLYKNGIAVMTKIMSGIRNEKEVQVLSGLAEGDTVITSGIISLKPNAKVKILKINF